MLLHGFLDRLTGKNKEAWKEGRIRGTVVLVRKEALGFNHFHASVLDGFHQILGHEQGLAFRLVSATAADPGKEGRGKVGNEAHLEEAVVTLKSKTNGETVFRVSFEWDESQGIPGAVLVKNHWSEEVFLKTLTLEGVPGKGTVVFIANSWIYPHNVYTHDRIVFANDTRAKTMKGQFLVAANTHIPVAAELADPQQKLMADFLGYSLKAIVEAVLPTLNTYIDDTPLEFDSFEDILGLYETGPEAPNHPLMAAVREKIPSEFLRSLLPNGAHDHPLKMPLPNIIKSDVLKKAPEYNFGWRTDEEFAREMLAGVNPVMIKRLTEFPPKSTLDQIVYGDQTSKITEAHIQHNLEGLTVQNALRNNRLFILDHHDNFMPYLDRINELEGNFIYASRTLLFLKDDGTLKPLAIELSLPHPDGQQHGADSKVYTPAQTGVESHIWQLAKAYACVNDSAWHQLISHWLNTHAVIEPFAIATNRHLSVVHPVHKLLSPHYRDTLNINALARQTLINADGIFEKTVFPAKYALEMSSDVYKSWNFTEQGLPADLVKRGMAVPDETSPYGVRLLIKDYPEYLDIYYPNDGDLGRDVELQAWWKEVREEAHGDLKDREWWPKMETVQELAKTCTTIIWIASALHAAVNFGQYPYAGYLPNRPTVSRRPMPEPGSKEYAMLEAGQKEADLVFIHTITSQWQTILGISLIEILSKHASDEVYLGQRDEPDRWTSDARALEAFNRFGSRLREIEDRITKMNGDSAFKNRTGPVDMPYMLLFPNTSDVDGKKGEGLTAMGIPNSISI
ncbi:hypothetical protein PR202_gb11300 [Eleusine coracana subsp. coracana]|uniref:Lipoxygenase n=1 Tax=Eleusine coracana subsp. coracana TaxID=191504 RepID=A0AAV5EN00_ELECO|nr:hypothetical protein PR202_gb11300 [Eleusine coracana subsp. coracana]